MLNNQLVLDQDDGLVLGEEDLCVCVCVCMYVSLCVCVGGG